MQSDHKSGSGVIIILGMHRSGTSCLSGSLQQAGLYLGDVNESAPHNAKGNRENLAIMHLHDDVLRASGGSWEAPPPTITWQASHKAQRDLLIRSYPRDRLWGFKDPRTLLVLDGWLEKLPEARFVGSFRHPLAVSESLQKRQPFSQSKAIALWEIYNQLLLRYHERFNFELVCFDWPPERYEHALKRIANSLNLSQPAEGFSFFERALRSNYKDRSEALPQPVGDLYGALRKISDREEAN